ncbi:hypothetical protein [Granulosicoccus antarcticus]|uniref:Uncharacterized protein n=1 Tax=Granulosicoccus antarcticus IMCC3135 TaxID=1192854 RepID=A0A2Z2NGY9_9GAMM|nr:hypothetical protein [Granulosicoccus antarcticus]ASJ70343.1 hypothetical protein IMCC3135_01105 [Granulosicoccus antarcticus IMCC3135]
MAKLRKLINGQNISFDTHQAGDGQGVHWKNVHLEKTVHNKQGKVRFPLLSEERPSNVGMNEKDFRKISREVKKELRKNSNLVNDLVDAVLMQLDRFSEGEATLIDAQTAARKLAGYFDLDERIISSLPSRYKDMQLERLSTLHRNPARSGFIEIEQSSENVVIRKASNSVILKHLEKNQ